IWTSVLDWREPKTLCEYMQHAFKESILFYVFNPLFHSVLIWIHGSLCLEAALRASVVVECRWQRCRA
ncbi:unnamed protein product, partial [Tilletia laevis]